MITVLSDETHQVPGHLEVGADGTHRVLVAAEQLAAATGWSLRPEGLCRGDTCVPTRFRPDLVVGGAATHRPSVPPDNSSDLTDSTGGGALVDLAVLAELCGQALVVDADEQIAALGAPAADRVGLSAGDPAPEFSLPDLRGEGQVSLADHPGRKKLLLTWSSWCGCRHELPAWESHYRELAARGLEIIAVAVDEHADAARPFVEEAGATYACAIDRDHRLVEDYGILNVPSAVWIDEDDRVVRTPDLAYGDRMWIDFHGVAPEPHLDALRAWVNDGTLPTGDDARAQRRAPTEHEQRARLHHRMALHLYRAGRAEAAEAHFATACELAPYDWTIRRGSMPLRGADPFGAEFFAFWKEWEDAGQPLYD